MKHPSTRLGDRASINLWFSIAAPILIMLFLYLFLSITVAFDLKRSTQNAGDLAAQAAVAEIDVASMLLIPQGETEPTPRINEGAAVERAKEYLGDNLTPMSNFYPANLTDMLVDANLELDPADGTPMSSSTEGIGIAVLNDVGVDMNPLSGKPITTPSVIVVIQLTIHAVMVDRHITTYSFASF